MLGCLIIKKYLFGLLTNITRKRYAPCSLLLAPCSLLLALINSCKLLKKTIESFTPYNSDFFLLNKFGHFL